MGRSLEARSCRTPWIEYWDSSLQADTHVHLAVTPLSSHTPAYFLSIINDKVRTESEKLNRAEEFSLHLRIKKKNSSWQPPRLVSTAESDPVKKSFQNSADYRKISQSHLILLNSFWSRPQIWRGERFWNPLLSFVKTHACPSLISFRFCLPYKNKT